MSLKGMGSIVREKDAFMRDMMAAVPCQSLTHTTSSPSHLDGLAPTGPNSAPPLPITAPSGVSRPQFLVAAQAASLPCFPSYCDQDGGVVLDRELLHLGGDNWWSTLAGRVKPQRMLANRESQGWGPSLSDPANYALCHNTFVRLPQQTVLKTKLAWTPDTEANRFLHGSPKPVILGSWQAPAWVSHMVQQQRHMSAAGSLRRKLKNSEIRFEASVNQKGADPGSREVALPFQASIDIRPAANQLNTVQYRLGAQHLVTSATSAMPATSGLPTSTHIHAAVAVQGNHCLWSGNASARRANNIRRQDKHKKGAAGQPGAGHSSGPILGPHNPIRQILQNLLRPSSPAENGNSEPARSKPHKTSQRRVGLDLQNLVGVEVPEPEEVQESVMDATQSIKRLREDVQSLADWVSSGSFTEQLERQLGVKGGTVKPRTERTKAAPSHAQTSARAPWSSLVGAPHLKVAGLMGVYLRQPVFTSLPGTASAQLAPTSSDAQLRSPSQPGLEPSQSTLMGRANSLSVDLVRSSVAWMMNTAGSLVRPETYGSNPAAGGAKVGAFGSLAASAQLGWMQRPVLDFTRVSARMDLGVLGQPPLPHTGKRSDWSWLHGPLPCWHALTVSLSQQLIGPVRLCGDLRYSVEPRGLSGGPMPSTSPRSPLSTRASTSGGGVVPSQRSDSMHARARQAVTAQLQGAAAQVRSARPQLVDAAVALDVVMPGSNGFARLVAWYAPLRKEGMLELRLL